MITNTNDTTNVDGLRGAIISANSNQLDQDNYIILDGGASDGTGLGGRTYYLTITGPDEANSLTGDLNVT